VLLRVELRRELADPELDVLGVREDPTGAKLQTQQVQGLRTEAIGPLQRGIREIERCIICGRELDANRLTRRRPHVADRRLEHARHFRARRIHEIGGHGQARAVEPRREARNSLPRG